MVLHHELSSHALISKDPLKMQRRHAEHSPSCALNLSASLCMSLPKEITLIIHVGKLQMLTISSKGIKARSCSTRALAGTGDAGTEGLTPASGMRPSTTL